MAYAIGFIIGIPVEAFLSQNKGRVMQSQFFTEKYTTPQRVDAKLKARDGIPCLCDNCTKRRLMRQKDE